jgi:hypothetical protein
MHHGTIPSRARTAALALTVASVAAAACSDDADGGGTAPGDAVTTTAPAPAASTTAPAPAEPGGAGTGTGGSGGAAGSGAPAPDQPLDRPLDHEVRHPNGVVLRLSRLTLDGSDIVVDAEVVNGSRSEIVFHFGNVTGERLRLVDDAGVEYNFVEPAEDEDVIEIAAGETLDATLAFRGPLSGRPGRLRLVTNVYPDELDGFDVTQESDTTQYPGFVVPIDLAGS